MAIEKKRELKDFNPSKMLDDFASSGLDASMFEGLDESKFKKAPNIVEFVVNPEFLNATILPKQIEMGLKLFAEYCPSCSDLEFLDSLYDQDLGTIKRKVILLEHGICPSCNKTRWDFIQEGKLNDYNEFAGCLGQRCIPKDSMVFTNRGIVPMNTVEVGDIVSHGFVSKKIDSGKLRLRTLKTEIGWDFKGSKESHIVPVYKSGKIIHKKMKEVKIGEKLLMISPRLFPPLNNPIYNKHTRWTNKFDRATSTFFGMVCRKFQLEETKLTIESKDIQIVFDMFFDLFDLLPKVENGKIIIDNLDFIDWFKIMTGGKQIPDGIMQATEDSVGFFIESFLYDDWSEDGMILSLDINEVNQIKELQMLFLNLGQITMVIDGQLKNIGIDTTDENVIELGKKGYYPIIITEIVDGEEVEMADIQVPNTNIYVADGFLHHNSGKSKFIGIVANYVLHRFLCMPNPIRQFNQSAGDVLNISFAGLSEDKVEKNLWGPFTGFMESSPWFQAYHSFLDEKGKELKKPLYTKRKTFLEYFHKKILIDFYGSNGTSMRGDTRIFASPDEIAWMGSGLEAKGGTVMNADAIHTSLNNSLATMRMKRRQIFNEKNFDVPPILMASISSPSSSKDKIMKLVKASKTNPMIYGVQEPSWLCLTNNSLIRSKEGIFKPNEIIATLDGRKVQQKEFKHSLVHDIITKNGSLISATPEHKFAVFYENTLMEKPVTVGDQILRDFSQIDFDHNLSAIVIEPQTKNGSFAGKQLEKFELNNNFFKLLGLFLAEGSLFDSDVKYKTMKRIVWYNTDEEIVSYCKKATINVWNLTPSIVETKPNITKTTNRKKKISRIQIDNTQLIYELRKLQINDSRLSYKKMPEIAFKCGLNNIVELLVGFLEGDGCIHNGKSNGEISFWNTSENLIRSISKMLFALGVPNKIYTKKKLKKHHSPCWNCRITGKDAIQRFYILAYDKLITTKNRENLKSLVNRSSRGSFYNYFSGKFLEYFKALIDSKTIGTINRRKLKQKQVSRKTLINIYESQLNRCSTIEKIIYNDFYFDEVVNINNSRSEDVYDISMGGSDHLYWSDGFISHNCNPDFTEDSLLKEFASMDPAEFYRDFGAQPPIESNPFLSETNPIDRIAIIPPTNLYEFAIEKDSDALGDTFVYGRLIINQMDINTPRLLAFDLGSTKNAFGMSVFKMDSEGRIILEGGLIIKPSKNCKINLPWVYEKLTVPFMDSYNVRFVFFDKWQSLDQVTRIRDRGINAQVYSLKYADMDDVRGMVKNRGVLIPKLSKPMVEFKSDWEANDEINFSEISAILGIQLLTVRDLGNRMVKPAHGDDDLFRSFALGVCALSTPKIIKEMQTKKDATNHTGGVGVVASYGGGSSAVSGVSSSIGVLHTRKR